MESPMAEPATLERQREAESHPQTTEIAPNLPAGLIKGLRNYWYPVLASEEVRPGKAVGFTALCENLVAWRDRAGAPQLVHDRCPHRSIRLSLGRVFDGHLQCILHGLRFDGEGRCVM